MKSHPHPFLRNLAMLQTLANNKEKGKKPMSGYRDNNARAFYHEAVSRIDIQHITPKEISDVTGWMTDRVLAIHPSFKERPIQFFVAYKSLRYPGLWSMSTYKCSFIGRYLAFPKKVAEYMIKEVWCWNTEIKQPCVIVYWSADGYNYISRNTEELPELIQCVEKFIDELDDLCF